MWIKNTLVYNYIEIELRWTKQYNKIFFWNNIEEIFKNIVTNLIKDISFYTEDIIVILLIK